MMSMRQLMQQDVLHELAWQKEQLVVEVDSPVGRATAPARFLTSNTDRTIAQVVCLAELLQFCGEMVFCLLPDVSPQGPVYIFGFVDTATQDQLLLLIGQVHSMGAGFLVLDLNSSVNGKEPELGGHLTTLTLDLQPLGLKLVQGSMDPVLLLIQKGPQQAYRRPLGQGGHHAILGGYAEAHPFGAFGIAYLAAFDFRH